MTEQQKSKGPGGIHLPGLLLVLFLAFVLSSGMVGFLLGKNAAGSTGKLVDTIVLSPGDSSLRQQEVLHFLSGQLQYRDGSPCAGAVVRLGGDERSGETDEQGKFYLSDIRSGSYTLEVLNQAGDMLASMELVLDFSAGGEIEADSSGSPAAFHMAENTRLLELAFTVEEDKTLTVDQESACFVTRDGQVVNFDGSALRVKENTHAVTPGGGLVDPAGYVMLPSQEVVFTPRGEQVRAEKDTETAPGAVIQEDGSVRVEEGATLLPSGEVELPGGETVGGGNKVVVITEEGAEEIDPLPDVYVPPLVLQEPVESEEPAESEGPAESEKPEESMEPPESEASQGEEPLVKDAGETVSESPVGEIPPQPEPTPVPENQTGFSVSDKDLVWRQESIINLFSSENRTDNLDLGERDGVPLAAPGSKGYYEFRLENPEEYDIAYTISLKESSKIPLNLPIRYSVVNTANNFTYLYREQIGEEEALVSEEILIPAKTVQNFRIDWEWTYDDWFRPEIDDAADTAAVGKRYTVSVLLNAWQVPGSVPMEPSGDTRYPGKR